jgi:hypothetical protein
VHYKSFPVLIVLYHRGCAGEVVFFSDYLGLSDEDERLLEEIDGSNDYVAIERISSHQQGGIQDAQAEQRWFLSDSNSPPNKIASTGSTCRLRRFGVPKEGYTECRSQKFVGVTPMASRAGSRPPTFSDSTKAGQGQFLEDE